MCKIRMTGSTDAHGNGTPEQSYATLTKTSE
jgi:hypothetical protein